MIKAGVDVILINAIQNYRFFATNFFNFKIILTLRIFENAVVSRVLNLTFCCAMSQRAPVGKVQLPSFKEAKDTNDFWWDYVTTITPGTYILPNYSTIPHTSNMWRYGLDGCQWFHRNLVIPVLPKINTHFVITFPTT